MREISVKEAKTIQMGILDAVDLYCQEKGLTYYMSYGTLLGAVRHKGFIPWDDDIDIAMPYPDYMEFCALFGTDKYRINHWSKDRNFHCNFAKIEDMRTLSNEKITSTYSMGINIDLAPIIGLPSDLDAAKRYFSKIIFYRNCLTLKKMKIRKGRKLHKQLILIGSRVLLSFVSYQMINKKIDVMCRKYPYNSSKYVICVGSFNPVKEIIEKNKLGKTIKLSFEDRKYSAPEGYDAWLTQIFGNYMKLPPVEKQVTHHEFQMFWR